MRKIRFILILLLLTIDANSQAQSTERANESITQNSENSNIKDKILDSNNKEIGLKEYITIHMFDLFLFLLILISFFYIFKRRNFASINRVEFMINENKKNQAPYKSGDLYGNNNNNKRLEEQIKNLEIKINSLEEKIKKLELLPKDEISSPVVIFEMPKDKPILIEETVFYKHAPHETGYFDVDNNVNLQDAVFKFIVNKNNPNSASFEILKDNKRLILDYPNKYIKPICDELNALNQNAADIILTPGLVEKRDNKWVIKTKAQIKYI